MTTKDLMSYWVYLYQEVLQHSEKPAEVLIELHNESELREGIQTGIRQENFQQTIAINAVSTSSTKKPILNRTKTKG